MAWVLLSRYACRVVWSQLLLRVRPRQSIWTGKVQCYSGLHQEMHRALPSPPINNWKHTAGYPTGWRVVASIYARVYPPQCQLSPLAIRQWKLSPVWSGASVKAIAAKHVSSCSWRHTVCPRACLSLLLPLGQLPYQQLRPTLSSAMSAT